MTIDPFVFQVWTVIIALVAFYAGALVQESTHPKIEEKKPE